MAFCSRIVIRHVIGGTFKMSLTWLSITWAAAHPCLIRFWLKNTLNFLSLVWAPVPRITLFFIYKRQQYRKNRKLDELSVRVFITYVLLPKTKVFIFKGGTCGRNNCVCVTPEPTLRNTITIALNFIAIMIGRNTPCSPLTRTICTALLIHAALAQIWIIPAIFAHAWVTS